MFKTTNLGHCKLCNRILVSNLNKSWNYLEGWKIIHFFLFFTAFDSTGINWTLRIYISNNFPGDTDATADPGNTLREPLTYFKSSLSELQTSLCLWTRRVVSQSFYKQEFSQVSNRYQIKRKHTSQRIKETDPTKNLFITVRKKKKKSQKITIGESEPHAVCCLVQFTRQINESFTQNDSQVQMRAQFVWF